MPSRIGIGSPIERFAGSLPGTLTDKRRARLGELFAEDGDASAVDVYCAWHGEDVLEGDDDATRSASALLGADAEESSSFDPVTDQPYNSTRVDVRRAYQDALSAGLEDEAAYLRALPHDHQQSFGALLRQEYITSDDLEQ